MNNKRIIRMYWDDQDRDNAGWYVMIMDGNRDFVDDSIKIWFPVNVNEFGPDDEAALKDALMEAYPDAEFE